MWDKNICERNQTNKCIKTETIYSIVLSNQTFLTVVTRHMLFSEKYKNRCVKFGEIKKEYQFFWGSFGFVFCWISTFLAAKWTDTGVSLQCLVKKRCKKCWTEPFLLIFTYLYPQCSTIQTSNKYEFNKPAMLGSLGNDQRQK